MNIKIIIVAIRTSMEAALTPARMVITYCACAVNLPGPLHPVLDSLIHPVLRVRATYSTVQPANDASSSY